MRPHVVKAIAVRSSSKTSHSKIWPVATKPARNKPTHPMIRARHNADASLPRSAGLKNASPTYSKADGWTSSATMAIPRQNSAWDSSSNPTPFARLATAVAPNSAARLRCEELACFLTNSTQAIPPAIAATRNAATENHVGSIIIDLPNLGTGAVRRLKDWVRSSEFEVLNTSAFRPPHVLPFSLIPPFPLVSPVPRSSDMSIKKSPCHGQHCVRESVTHFLCQPS